MSTFGLEDIALRGYILVEDGGAGIGDASYVAGINHHLDVCGVCLPMLVEDTGRAAGSEDVGVGSKRVFAYRVLLLRAGSILGVVVFHKTHRIAAVGSIADESVLCSGTPVGSDEVAHGVTHGEVEGSRCGLAVDLGGIYPGLDGIGVAVPVFAYGAGVRHGAGVCRV